MVRKNKGLREGQNYANISDDTKNIAEVYRQRSELFVFLRGYINSIKISI